MLKNFQQPRIITPRQDSNAPARRLDAEGVREFQIQDLGAELNLVSRVQVGIFVGVRFREYPRIEWRKVRK